ncbi:MAG: putative 26S proteasome non-ATPase regulatory subunit 2 [Streblomastix strix]|uniref:Putative 26S proteasome non-ATPase regulatory subunit 2 n=1 Tax=Streblomastix strix TaxID=222440 RepID=A0A5J4X1T7_9EUKA|nr:MAG: putative 26S proteasome non-ATPase regulatory subunit 2 [Streblomastix strix]
MSDLDAYEGRIEEIPTDFATFPRVFRYFSELIRYLPEGEEKPQWEALFKLALKNGRKSLALLIALRMRSLDRIQEAYATAEEGSALQRQFSYILASTEIRIPDKIEDTVMNGEWKSTFHLSNAAHLDIIEAKSPEDVYKSHLIEKKNVFSFDERPKVDSAKENLAKTIVSAIVNCGFQSDTLMILKDEVSKWVYQHKDIGQTCAIASIGLLQMWNLDQGANEVEKYSQCESNYIIAGIPLGYGVMTCGIQSQFDAANGLIGDNYLESEDKLISACSYLGLGLAYSCTGNTDMEKLAKPLVESNDAPPAPPTKTTSPPPGAQSSSSSSSSSQQRSTSKPASPANQIIAFSPNDDVCAISALACGMVFAGSGNETIFYSILQALLEKGGSKHPLLKLYSVGLGLLFLQKGDEANAAIESCKDLHEDIRDHAALTIQYCAYAGTGNVIIIQKLLHECTKPGKEVAIIGIALVAFGEKLGQEMALRHFERMIQYGTPAMRVYIPIALGLLSVSNPTLGCLPFLSKMTHDVNNDVCMSALLGLGLMAAGTNNGATAKLFRELSSYHEKRPDVLFITRIGQALVHLGKGSLTISPLIYDSFLVSRPALVGLISFANVAVQCSSLLLDKYTYLIYTLTPAIHSRVVSTRRYKVQGTIKEKKEEDKDKEKEQEIEKEKEKEEITNIDENQDFEQEVSVRVGQAVDIAGLPGRPNIVTGFQTMTSPAVVQSGQRIEINDPKWVPLTDIIDGVVVVERKRRTDDEEEETKPESKLLQKD